MCPQHRRFRRRCFTDTSSSRAPHASTQEGVLPELAAADCFLVRLPAPGAIPAGRRWAPSVVAVFGAGPRFSWEQSVSGRQPQERRPRRGGKRATQVTQGRLEPRVLYCVCGYLLEWPRSFSLDPVKDAPIHLTEKLSSEAQEPNLGVCFPRRRQPCRGSFGKSVMAIKIFCRQGKGHVRYACD